MDLLNEQWELDGYVFGVDSPVGHDVSVSPGGRNWRVQDINMPMRDAVMMGRDYLEPDVWAFELYTNQDNQTDALAELAKLGDIWRGDDVRDTPGAVMPLRYRIADRTRVVFGRPRKFDYTLDNRSFGGYIPITADFKLSSSLFYDDYENSLVVGMNQPVSGGFHAPIRAPIRVSSNPGSLPYLFTVGGEKPAPITVDFTGPLYESGIMIDGRYVIQLNQPVPAGVTLTVDARPWVIGVSRSDGGGVAGMLSPRSRMPNMTVKPGTHSATLMGTSPTGAGYARLRWRHAHPTI